MFGVERDAVQLLLQRSLEKSVLNRYLPCLLILSTRVVSRTSGTS